MAKWVRFTILFLLALPVFIGHVGYSVPEVFHFGLPDFSDQLVYSALAINFVIFLLIGWRSYSNILTVAIVLSVMILFAGPLIRYFSEAPESYSVYYLGKFINMLTVIPAALGLLLLFPADQVERKLLTPGKSNRKWRKAAIVFVRVIRHIFFEVLPLLRERILEEATPYHCIAQIWRRDKRAGRPLNAIGNIAIFFSQFCIEIFIYALGASVKNAGLWSNWITQVSARAYVPKES